MTTLLRFLPHLARPITALAGFVVIDRRERARSRQHDPTGRPAGRNAASALVPCVTGVAMTIAVVAVAALASPAPLGVVAPAAAVVACPTTMVLLARSRGRCGADRCDPSTTDRESLAIAGETGPRGGR